MTHTNDTTLKNVIFALFRNSPFVCVCVCVCVCFIMYFQCLFNVMFKQSCTKKSSTTGRNMYTYICTGKSAVHCQAGHTVPAVHVVLLVKGFFPSSISRK